MQLGRAEAPSLVAAVTGRNRSRSGSVPGDSGDGATFWRPHPSSDQRRKRRTEPSGAVATVVAWEPSRGGLSERKTDVRQPAGGSSRLPNCGCHQATFRCGARAVAPVAASDQHGDPRAAPIPLRHWRATRTPSAEPNPPPLGVGTTAFKAAKEAEKEPSVV